MDKSREITGWVTAVDCPIPVLPSAPLLGRTRLLGYQAKLYNLDWRANVVFPESPSHPPPGLGSEGGRQVGVCGPQSCRQPWIIVLWVSWALMGSAAYQELPKTQGSQCYPNLAVCIPLGRC
jgi:hypothetical protein